MNDITTLPLLVQAPTKSRNHNRYQGDAAFEYIAGKHIEGDAA